MRLEARAPFHLEATVRLLQRRPTNAVDRWEDEAWSRLHATAQGPVLTRVRNLGSLDEPDVRLDFPGSSPSAGEKRRLAATVGRMLALPLDASSFFARASRTQGLAPLARALRGLRPPRYPTLFEAMGNTIPFQQVSLDAGVAIVRRLVEHYGLAAPIGGTIRRAFPTPEALVRLDPESLRALGLSAAKARSLIAAARTIAGGDIDEAVLEGRSTPELLEELGRLPGIGPWSAGLIALRGLGRLDTFPEGDVGIARAFAPITDVPPDQLAAGFGDQRGLLYFFALGSKLLEAGLIRPAP